MEEKKIKKNTETPFLFIYIAFIFTFLFSTAAANLQNNMCIYNFSFINIINLSKNKRLNFMITPWICMQVKVRASPLLSLCNCNLQMNPSILSSLISNSFNSGETKKVPYQI